MRWNTITSSSIPCFAHCLGHQCKICSHLLLFIFQLLEVRELFFWNLEKYWAWISQNFSKNPYSFNSKKDYLCSLLWNYEANCEALFAVCFEITKQTAKHPLQFQSKLQSTLCSFKPSFVVFIKVQRSFCSLDWNCKVCFAVCFESAKCALQFALKVRSVLCSLLWNFKANCKGILHFDLKLFCFLKNFVRFMPNTFQNDIQKTSEWIKSLWWTWKKCCNPGLSNNSPETL